MKTFQITSFTTLAYCSGNKEQKRLVRLMSKEAASMGTRVQHHAEYAFTHLNGYEWLPESDN